MLICSILINKQRGFKMNNLVQKNETDELKTVCLNALKTHGIDFDPKRASHAMALSKIKDLITLGLDPRASTGICSFIKFKDQAGGENVTFVENQNLYKFLFSQKDFEIDIIPCNYEFLDKINILDNTIEGGKIPLSLKNAKKDGYLIIRRAISSKKVVEFDFVDMDYINKVKNTARNSSIWTQWTILMEIKTAYKWYAKKIFHEILGMEQVSLINEIIKEDESETQGLKETAKALSKPATHNTITGKVEDVEPAKVEAQQPKQINEVKHITVFADQAINYLSDSSKNAPKPKHVSNEEPPFNLGEDEEA